MWQKARKRAGLMEAVLVDGDRDPLRPHDLRHVFATYAERAGLSEKQIGLAGLGHDDLETTARYRTAVSGSAVTTLRRSRTRSAGDRSQELRRRTASHAFRHCADLRCANLRNRHDQSFEFDRELSAAEIVDRTDEVARVDRALRQRERLFVIGPRRFGKTSILRAATERAEAAGAVVLRYNAEAFPALTALAERLVADSAHRLTGPIQKAGERVREAFGALRPQVAYDPFSSSWSASLSAAQDRPEPVLIADALTGLDTLAAASEKSVAVVLDEFQRVVGDGGISAEGQIRAAVQTHEHVGYVFAGSKTRMLAEMTGDESRPFYRLGARLFVGPVPREDFRPAIASGFCDAGLDISDDAVEAILDLAQDVSYNVQRLAHEAWAEAFTSSEAVTPEGVQTTLDRLVGRDDPFYTQTWNGLIRTQKQALLAGDGEGGTGLYAGDLLRTYGLASPSTMRTALQALTKDGVARDEEHQGGVRVRLEDPFFAARLRLFVAVP